MAAIGLTAPQALQRLVATCAALVVDWRTAGRADPECPVHGRYADALERAVTTATTPPPLDVKYPAVFARTNGERIVVQFAEHRDRIPVGAAFEYRGRQDGVAFYREVDA